MKPYWRLIGLRSYPDRQLPYTKRVTWQTGILPFWIKIRGCTMGTALHLTSTITSDAASDRQYPQPGLVCLYTHRGHRRQCPFDYDAFLAKEEMEGGSKLNVKAFTTPNGATDCYWEGIWRRSLVGWGIDCPLLTAAIGQRAMKGQCMHIHI